MEENFSMEWSMEENFSMEWNMEENFSMEWKIFGMEWKWNGRKLPVWNMEKSASIPYHALLVAREVRSGGPQALSEIQTILCMSEMSSQYPYYILNLYRIYNVLQTLSSLPMGRDQRWVQITLCQKRNDFFNQ